MQPIDQEGKTVEEALQTALTTLDKKIEEVEYETLDEGSKGILGVGAKPALIRVWVKEPSEIKEAKELIAKIFESLEIKATLDSSVVNETNIKINIESEDSGILIGRQGQTLESLQYLINQILHFEAYRVILDISNYRERHTERITDMAQRVASKVKNSNRKITLKPMSSSERKTVHEAVRDIKDVTSTSIGSDPNRRVVIAPTNAPGERRRSYPPREGGYSSGRREGYPPREGGYSSGRREGYSPREGGYSSGHREGYSPREGGYSSGHSGGYAPREGGYSSGRREGYSPRESGYSPREGGYTPREGSTPPPREGGYSAGRREGYSPREGGYSSGRREGYSPREGGYSAGHSGGYSSGRRSSGYPAKRESYYSKTTEDKTYAEDIKIMEENSRKYDELENKIHEDTLNNTVNNNPPSIDGDVKPI